MRRREKERLCVWVNVRESIGERERGGGSERKEVKEGFDTTRTAQNLLLTAELEKTNPTSTLKQNFKVHFIQEFTQGKT
jgi:hypothetical protein